MKQKNVVAIIQARMGSTRLPGKVLARLSNRTILEHLINRLKVSKRINKIVIATSDKETDKPITELAKKMNVDYFTGSENDVLNRYYEAAKIFKADIIVRITADNPLTDPFQIDELIKKHIETRADYTHNKHQKGPPLGTAAEVISFPILEKINSIAVEPRHREHVTLYIFEHADQFNIRTVDAPPRMQRLDLRLTVDTEKDLTLMKEIFSKLDFEKNYVSLENIIEFLDKNRELIDINKSVRQKNVNFKIIQILDRMDVKGESILILQLARKLIVTGHDVIVVSHGGNLLRELDKSQIKHIEIKNTYKNQSHFFKHVFEIAKIIDKEKPDIIHAHDDYLAFVSAIAAKVSDVRPKTNVIWSIHTLRDEKEHYVYDKYISTYFDAITTVSQNLKDELIKHGIKNERIIVLPNFIEIEENLIDKNFKQKFLKKYGLDENTKIIGTVSRLHPLKGIQYLIKGFKKIKEKINNTVLVICGSGKYKKELETLTNEMNLNKNVIFTGFVRDRLNILKIFDLFILPSAKEGLPISILEAMSLGVPVVGTSVGGVPELIKNNVTGILIPPNNEDAITEAVISLLVTPEFKEKIASNGREYVRESFNSKKLFVQIEELYRKLIWLTNNTL